MKQVQKGSGHMLTALSQNNTFSGGDFIDIVGVTGSIPVAPTIRPSENIEIIAAEPIGCEVPVRFSEPEAVAFPDLVRYGAFSRIEPFDPGAAAYNWPQLRGLNGVLYVVECGGALKIGITRNFAKRLGDIDRGTPFPVRRVATRTVPLAGMAFAEKWMHHHFRDKRIKGEWFAISTEEVIPILARAVTRATAYCVSCHQWWEENVAARSAEERANDVRLQLPNEEEPDDVVMEDEAEGAPVLTIYEKRLMSDIHDSGAGWFGQKHIMVNSLLARGYLEISARHKGRLRAHLSASGRQALESFASLPARSGSRRAAA